MENNKERIKLFKRFMKEIGLYNSWVAARARVNGVIQTEERLTIKMGGKWDIVNRYSNLSSIIFYSFTWRDTGNPALWEIIHHCACKEEIDIDNYTAEDIEYIKKEIEPCLVTLKNSNVF